MRQHRDRLVKLWLAVLVAVVLSGCGKAPPAESGCREIEIFSSVTDSGIVTTYPEPLQFVDFESKESAVLCSEPDCDHQWHSDNDYCPAFEEHRYPFVYNGELYFFRSEMYRDSEGEVVDTCNLMKSDVSGTNEKTVCSVPGPGVTSLYVYLDQDVLYFPVNEYESSGAGNDERKVTLYACDLRGREAESCGVLVEGKDASVRTYGMTEDQMFYDTFTFTADVEADMTAEEIEALIEIKSYVMDVKTKEVRANELPKPAFVYGGCYYYNRDDGLYSRRLADGSETLIAERMFETEGGLSCYYADGKLFVGERPDGGSLYDIYLRYYDMESGKLTDIGENNKVCTIVLAAYKDEYFLSLGDYKQEDSMTKLAYIKKSDFLKGEFDRYILLN